MQAIRFTPKAIKPWSATQPSETGKVTKKVYFDVKQGSTDLGRITVGLYGKVFEFYRKCHSSADVFHLHSASGCLVV